MGTPLRTKPRLSSTTFLFPRISVLQDRAMRVLFAQLFVATAQRRLQFALQLLQVFQFLPDISQLCLQAAAHGRTRLHPASTQTQKSSNFAKFESQTLFAPDKGQSFDVPFTVLAKTSLGPTRPGQQRIALVEANRINTQPDFFGDDADLHGSDSFREATPWSIVRSQDFLFVSPRIPFPVPTDAWVTRAPM